MSVYVIAEIGINHNGSYENCIKLIDVAVNSGCNAVKFQTFSAEHLYPKTAGKLDWKDGEKKYSYDIYDAVKSFEINLEWIDSLMNYCQQKGIDFISSIFDLHSLDFLLKKGLKIIKLSSYSITHIPLVEACAKSHLPIIMSTGGATLEETEKAVGAVLKHHNKIQLLHCSIEYPTELKDCNLGVIETLKYAFPGIEIGYSDHTFEISDAPVQSIYLGGIIVEKHITLNKMLKGPDHFFALEPHELQQMVKDIKKAEVNLNNSNFVIDKLIYGSSAKICHHNERYLRDFSYMTLFANRKINKGEIIAPSDISILRPGKKVRGLDPKYYYLFENFTITAKKDIQKEDVIDWKQIL